jgi:hypothetical protein
MHDYQRQREADRLARTFKVPPWVWGRHPRPNRVVRAWYWLRGYRP